MGVVLPEMVTGIFMERLGLSVSAWAMTIYTASILVYGGVKGLTAAALCVAIVVAFLVRSHEITKVIKKLPRTAEVPTEHEN